MKNTGFTLVETLVSLFILSIAITGAFAVISFNLSNAISVRNSFVASGLAQEGMELTRNLRDTDWFAGREFGSFGDTSGPMSDGKYCVQWNSNVLINPCVNMLLKKDDQGFYNHTVGVDTIFSRAVQIQKVAGSPVKEIVIKIKVSWTERSTTKEINAEEHLYNWFQ